MAILTWRNVDSPDFRGAQAGIRNFGELLNNAATTANRGITEFQDSNALGNALTFTDPAEYQAALQSGQITTDGISNAAANSLGSRANDLIGQNARQFALDQTQQNAARMEQARPAIAALSAAAASGDPAALQAARTQYAPALAQLPVDQIAQALRDTQTLESGALNNTTSQRNSENAIREQNEARQAQALGQEITRTALSGDDALTSVESVRDKVSPGVLQKLLANLSGNYGNLYGPAGSTTTGQGVGATVSLGSRGGAPGTSQGSPYDVTVGNNPTPVPISGMNIGDAVKYGTENLIPATRGNRALGLSDGIGSSAMGAFQITAPTMREFAQKALGDGWETQQLNPQNQEKIAKAIFDERKSGNLADTWVSLPNKTPGAYKDMPWSEMRQIIARGESGSQLPTISDSQAETNAALTQLGVRNMQNIAQQGSATDLLKNLSSRSNAVEAVNELVKTTFPDADRGQLLDQLNEVTREANVSPAQAAAILARNAESSSVFEFLPFRQAGEVGGDFRVNPESLAAEIEGFRTGQRVDQATGQAIAGQQSQQIQTAQSAYEKAANDLLAVQRRAAVQPSLAGRLETYEQRAQAARNRLVQLLENQRGNPDLQPR